MYRVVSEEAPLLQSHIEQFLQSGALSVSSLTREKRMDLLKKGSPKSKALERLKAKIQQQRLETISSNPVIDINCQDRITRKVCSMSKKGERTQTCVPVSRWKLHINPSSGKERLNRGLQGTGKQCIGGKTAPEDRRNNAASKTRDGSNPRSKEPNVNICPPNQATNPPGSCGKSISAWAKGEENEGPARQSTAQTRDLRGYIHHKVLERRRREREMRRKAQFEQERKRMNVQDIVQKEKALYRTRREQASEAGKSKNDDKELFTSRSQTLGLQVNVQYAVLDTARTWQMFSDARSEIDKPVHLGDAKSSLMISGTAQRRRVEALRRTIASLDTRVYNETVRLGIGGHKEGSAPARPFGDKHEQVADRKKKKQKKEEEKKKTSINRNAIKVVSADEQACPAMSSQRRTTEHASDQDDSSDPTSERSELSGMYGLGPSQCHVSLAQSQQFIWEEELRARQFSALLRLRERALWERTQAELACLEHCEKNAQESDENATEIRKKQEDVLSTLRHEEAQIRHWRSVYKCGRQQRRLMLYQLRDISEIQKSTIHFRQALENQIMSETAPRPGDTMSVSEGKSLITKPGIIPAARGEDKPLSKQGRFLTKAGLRRLLTADEVWSLGRKRSLGDHNIRTEAEIQQTTGPRNSSFSGFGHRSKPCHNTGRETAERKHETVTTKPKPRGYEPKPAKKVKSPLHEFDPHPKVSASKSTEIHSGAKAHRTPLKDVRRFTSEHTRSSCGTSAHIVSCLSSDVEEDLPYDDEESGHEAEARYQATLKPHFEMAVECGDVITDNLTRNLRNSHRSQSLPFNNNHEVCEVSGKSSSPYTQAQEIDLVAEISENLKWHSIADSIVDKPLVTNAVHMVSSDLKRADSLSCDESLSEAEDKSEPFSLQSEGQVWSEEEKDVGSEEKSEAGPFALVYAEKFTVYPESLPHCQHSGPERRKVGPYCLLHNETQTESLLSEILSPVDEVLSYGSAELLPSLKGGVASGLDVNSLPHPPPAFEIITWTSEEDLPAPPDLLEDTSINSENIPPLPVDLTCKKDPGSPSEPNDASNADRVRARPDENEEDEGSEHTNSLPLDDSNGSQDPLSSFNIGDRVLVCNSRPGVLKYKGYTAFADGFWAGVALDTPNGNHDGTFRGVTYFKCEKSRGVLVRAEDVCRLPTEHCNDRHTGVDEDSFSDEEPPNSQDGVNGNEPSRTEQRRRTGPRCTPPSNPAAPKQPRENDVAAGNKFPTSCDETPPNIDRRSQFDSAVLIERLTEEIFADAFTNIQGMGSTNDGKPKEIKQEAAGAIHKPGLVEKWQQVYPPTPPQIRLKPHEHTIVYRLVDKTVDIVSGRANTSALEFCGTPNYLVDDASRKTYRQVVFQLVSDILRKIGPDIPEMDASFQETTEKRSFLHTKATSVELMKDAVKRETRKLLNLEQTDQEMTEMLQTLCKFWYAKRDRVDYILIQELHNEETEWVDYSNDQFTVKMRLTNEIFRMLLDDTISVLNHIYI